MKKNGFLGGAFVSTFCIIICKIVGLLYVIPFYAIIGESGGALYAYAYTIYSLFLTLSSQGIPVAMSKIISEYNTLNFHWSKEQAYKIVRNLMVSLGVLWFILLFIFAKPIAYLIIGEIKGGNSIEDVTLVIRSISVALIVVPFLSTIKGYLSGHKYITQYASSNVIEHLVRVTFIIVGSYIASKVFHLKTSIVVSVSVLGATIGALAAYLYLKIKKNKNKELFKIDAKKTKEESKNTRKTILKRIVLVALPFIIIDFVRSIYSIVDTFTINQTLTKLGFTLSDSEYVLSVISTWGSKLNMIIIAFVSGLTVSLIPNISSSFVKGDMKDVNNKINQSLEMIMFINLPMVLGLFFLKTPVWNLFYGNNQMGIDLFGLFIFQALTFSFYSISIDSTQIMGNTKLALGSLFISFLLKALLNIPFMYLFDSLGLNPSYAPIALNLILHTLTVIIIMIVNSKKYHLNYTRIINPMLKSILMALIMFLVLKIFELFIPVNIDATKGKYLLLTALYALIGGVIYLGLSYKYGLIDRIFKVNSKEFLRKKFKKIKK